MKTKADKSVVRLGSEIPSFLSELADRLNDKKKAKVAEEKKHKMTMAEAEEIGFFKHSRYLGRRAYQADYSLGEYINDGDIWYLEEAEDGSQFLMKETNGIGDIIRRAKLNKESKYYTEKKDNKTVEFDAEDDKEAKKKKKEMLDKEKEDDLIEASLDKKAEEDYRPQPTYVKEGDIVVVTYQRGSDPDLWGTAKGKIVSVDQFASDRGVGQDIYTVEILDDNDEFEEQGGSTQLLREEFLTVEEFEHLYNLDYTYEFKYSSKRGGE